MAVVSLMAISNALPEARANAAVRAAKGALVYARGQAMLERRNMQVTFVDPQEIRLTRVNLDGSLTELRRTLLEGTVSFQLFSQLPDTPDAFGKARSVTFADNQVIFTPDGEGVDRSRVPVSGTVFLGVPGSTLTARAVTLFGATGRVMGYRWDGRQWATSM